MTNPSRAPRDTATLLADLGARDVASRRQARNALVEMGEAALPGLLERLAHGDFIVRWEAAKALGEMKLPASVPGLVEAARDSEEDVRWVVSVALAGIGRPALAPLLESLLQWPESTYLRQSAHHVLTIYQEEELREPLMEVRDALGPMEDGIDVIPAAERALQAMRARSA